MAGGVAQVVERLPAYLASTRPEFKLQCCKKKKKMCVSNNSWEFQYFTFKNGYYN
jgi:hypothetical protein